MRREGVLFSLLRMLDGMKAIAIIGGGPAGAMAAEKLARGGAKVWVFEEKLGWEKPCGGGLSPKALQAYPFLSATTGHGRVIREMECLASNGAAVRFRLRRPLAIYSRSQLNQLLLQRAIEAGATVIGDRILDFHPVGAGWELRGRQGSYRAEYLILAAGARSRTFLELLRDLIEGSQSYPGLGKRLYLDLLTGLFEIASGSLRQALPHPRSAEI